MNDVRTHGDYFSGDTWPRHVIRTAFKTWKGLAILAGSIIVMAVVPGPIKVAGAIVGAVLLIALCKSTWNGPVP
jgi:flagellar biosynthesis component FlhA